MNEQNPAPPSIPPVIPTTQEPQPLGNDPAERIPIQNPFAAIESILRHPRRILFQLRQPGSGKLIALMFLMAVVCALVYGMIVGSFSGGMQWWAAPVKVALGLVISTFICLPSLYIFASLSGAEVKLTEVLGLTGGLLLLMTVLLIGFAPVAWLFSQSTESIAWMGSLHLLFWFVATTFGLRFLEAGFKHTNARSHAGLRIWTVIFILVVLQMSTALRPLLGTSETFLPGEKKFFLAHWGDCLKADGEKGSR